VTTIQALWLGIVQGLTEFLPVSSSGHLVIFQHLFGVKEAPLAFDVLVHWGTLLAVFVAFWGDIYKIIRRPFSKLTYLIVVGCIPAGLAGILLEPVFEKAFQSLLVVGIGLFITGIILMLSENMTNHSLFQKGLRETSYWDVIFIGIIQAIAIVPGISRSGSTIAGGLLAGLEREFAARYSFLLSIPVILGAGVIQLKDLAVQSLPDQQLLPFIIGPVAAAVSGFIAIKLVMRLVKKGRLSIFSYYCWVVGALTLAGYFVY
jgi:undecaprenyl-diphosphatase